MKLLERYKKSSVLRDTLLEESERLVLMEQQVVDELAGLPKGSVKIKVIKNKQYLYVRQWENKKIAEKYIGRVEKEESKQLIAGIERRKYLEERLVRIHLDREMAIKALKYEPKKGFRIKVVAERKGGDSNSADAGKSVLEHH